MPDQPIYHDLPEIVDTVEEYLSRPPMFRVILHNDDYTTMQFVIMVLEKVFRRTAAEATQIMLQVHHRGSGECGVYPYEIAETRVAQVKQLAEDNGFPLLCTIEEA